MASSYYSVLTSAIDDLLRRGYVSSTQVSLWQARLKEAAEAGFKSDLESSLGSALEGAFARLVDRGGLLRYHLGLPLSTLSRLRPILRNELTKRLLGGTSFLKLRREEALIASLRRFGGWASSLPAGPISTSIRAAKKREIRRPMSQLPLEESRAISDQTYKLTSSLNEIVSVEAEALAACWHSRWRQPGYNFRPDHKERDEKFFLFKGSWASQAGFLRPAPFVEDFSRPGEEPFCQCTSKSYYTLESLPPELLSPKGLAFIASRAAA